MKQLMVIGLVWLAGLTAVRAADEAFSRAVRAEDFSAAGLSKLSPDEIARLDALVRDYKTGVLAAAAQAQAAAEAKAARAEAEMQTARAEALKSETARAAAAKAAKEEAEVAKAEAAKAKKAEGGSLLSRARVLLTPGTEIEYATVESRIKGDFKGWEGKAILTLENGSRWQIANGGSYMTPPLPSPKVKVVPATMGGFWMTIEGMASRVKVVPLGAN